MIYSWFTFLLLVNFSIAVTFLGGEVGVGKTTLLNEITGSSFRTCESLKACPPNSGGIFNHAGEYFDLEGFNGFEGSSKHVILTAIFEVMHKQKSVRNFVWVRNCMNARLSKDMESLLNSLKAMKVKLNFVVHTSMCNGYCETCRLDLPALEAIYPVAAKTFTNHINHDPKQIDWDGVRAQYKELEKLESHPVSLPPNWREILNEDNYEERIRNWNEQNCEAVVKVTNEKVTNLEGKITDVIASMDGLMKESCSSNILKKDCWKEMKNVDYTCNRYCKTDIFGVCVDYKNVRCNKVEEYAVCKDVADFDAQSAEITACHAKKDLKLKELQANMENYQNLQTEARKEPSYAKCLEIVTIKAPDEKTEL